MEKGVSGVKKNPSLKRLVKKGVPGVISLFVDWWRHVILVWSFYMIMVLMVWFPFMLTGLEEC